MKIYRKNQSKWTDRPAPYLPGLYSLQAVGGPEDTLDVTTYRGTGVEMAKWKDVMVARGDATCFLLRQSETSWLVYDRNGEVLGESSDVVTRHIRESPDVVEVDRGVIEKVSRESLFNDDLSLIACAEGHCGASAADHSNFAVMCRRMITEASPEDLRHVLVVDSRRWPCRVAGLIADLSRLSGEMTDVFIDRVTWLRSGWPLNAQHHLTTFASRLATTRPRYVMDLLADCAAAAKLDPHLVPGLQAAWMVAGPGYRYRFALAMVTKLQEGILFRPAVAETFSTDIVERHAKSLIQDFYEMMP